MIARVWRGVIRAKHAEEYITCIEDTDGGGYERTPGNQGAWTMSGIDGDRAEIIALSFSDSRRAVEGYAGSDIEHEVLYLEDKRYLLAPPTISHHDAAAL
jgi:hypothetical protein